MPKSIKTAIYKTDLFKPQNNSGYSLDTFYHYSDDLTEYSPDALERALDDLLKCGHLRKEDGKPYYWSTRSGRIACQIHFSQIGVLSKPLEKQKSYALHDLILAALASNSVSPFSGSDSISLEALSIYFHEFSDKELNETKLELEIDGLASEDNFSFKKAIQITGRGLHAYKTDIRKRLNLGPNEGILRLVEAPQNDARFDRLGFDKDLQRNLEHRWFEMEACAHGEAYLAATIMLGSILEGALLAKIKENIGVAMSSAKSPKNRAGTTKSLDEWTLSDLIVVSTDLGFVPKSVEKHSHELRDTRNFVHPRKQVSERIIVDESLYRISREVAETVIDALSS
ncbi:hypothetical protein [Pandoraea pnomenusa]|uniref:hypothetical protein n=1 Tax=Pandoraea pnomenusa TaxID=93220 RepID=UPI00333EF115